MVTPCPVIFLGILAILFVFVATEGMAAETGMASQGWLGIGYKPTPRGQEGTGVVVGDVEKDSPAERVGIKPKDVLLMLDDQSIPDHTVFLAALDRIPPGKRVRILLTRNARPIVVEVTAAEFPPFYAHLEKAYQFMDQRRYDQAVAELTSAIQMTPNHLGLYELRSVAWGLQGRDDMALADCDRVLRLNPNYAPGYVNRGIGRFRTGDLNGSLADLNAAEKLGETANPNLHSQRAYTLELLGRPAQAVSDMERAAALEPENAGYRQEVERLRAASREGIAVRPETVGPARAAPLPRPVREQDIVFPK